VTLAIARQYLVRHSLALSGRFQRKLPFSVRTGNDLNWSEAANLCLEQYHPEVVCLQELEAPEIEIIKRRRGAPPCIFQRVSCGGRRFAKRTRQVTAAAPAAGLTNVGVRRGRRLATRLDEAAAASRPPWRKI